MKHLITLFFVAWACFAQTASANPQTEMIRQLAAESNEALTSGNYSRYVDLTYPKAVQMLGGRSRMIELLRTTTEQIKAIGITVLDTEFSEPGEVVRVGHKRFSIVPMTVHLQAPQGTFWKKSFLVAVSGDDGATWQFLDGAGLVKDPAKTKEKLAQVLPDFPAELALPALEPPRIEAR